jgi:hypothetical protein
MIGHTGRERRRTPYARPPKEVYEQRWLPVSRGGTDTLSLAIIEAGPMYGNSIP